MTDKHCPECKHKLKYEFVNLFWLGWTKRWKCNNCGYFELNVMTKEKIKNY